MPSLRSLGLAGLAVLANGLALAAQQQAQPQQTQPSPFPAPLYQRTDVTQSLNLNQQQVDRLNQVTQQTQARYRDRINELGNLQPAERAARMQELNRQYATDWSRGANDVFNENQRTRYQQLNWQYGGFTTLSDPDIQRRLNLTDTQRAALQGNVDWSATRMRDIDRQMASDANLGRQQYRDYQREYETRFNRLLTPEQQRSWRELTGEPFSFQPGVAPPR